MGNLREISEVAAHTHDALWQMFRNGPIWDGDLLCKTSRNWLVSQGYAEQSSGFNFLTAMGVDLAVSVGMDRRKERDHG